MKALQCFACHVSFACHESFAVQTSEDGLICIPLESLSVYSPHTSFCVLCKNVYMLQHYAFGCEQSVLGQRLRRKPLACAHMMLSRKSIITLALSTLYLHSCTQ